MYYVMSSSTDIIVVDGGKVRYHQGIGFSVECRHRSCEAAEKAAESLEQE